MDESEGFVELGTATMVVKIAQVIGNALCKVWALVKDRDKHLLPYVINEQLPHRWRRNNGAVWAGVVYSELGHSV